MGTDPTTDDERELSEVNNLDPKKAQTPVSDGDHIAGSPSNESGKVEEGEEVGPDARVRSEHHRHGKQ